MEASKEDALVLSFFYLMGFFGHGLMFVEPIRSLNASKPLSFSFAFVLLFFLLFRFACLFPLLFCFLDFFFSLFSQIQLRINCPFLLNYTSFLKLFSPLIYCTWSFPLLVVFLCSVLLLFIENRCLKTQYRKGTKGSSN